MSAILSEKSEQAIYFFGKQSPMQHKRPHLQTSCTRYAVVPSRPSWSLRTKDI